MASPPFQSPSYRSPAASPPNPAHSVLPNPRKRPLGTTLQTGGFNKKRKPSSFSATSSTHPLRQTSFPPEEGHGGERSPSVDSDYTTVTASRSVATSAMDAGRKGARRKRDTASVTSHGKNRAMTDGGSKTGLLEDEPEEDEGEAADDELVGETGVRDGEADKENLAILMEAFDRDQGERYNIFRRIKLKKETVRKITNQTLSQSVPPGVVTTINGYTKVFIGTLIERARHIQQQAEAAESCLPSPQSGVETSRPSSSHQVPDIPDQAAGERKKEQYAGPLLPDHLRESFRRYKRNGEGGGAGVSGLSVGLGLPGAAIARTGGKRLFR